ncbi:phage integrase SAM-like domain-containing protein [Bacteroides hominis]|uniref:phage integrase SAM-like domain-containing protein n=1 Tax=Bacteroides TaxID=816 RepID=UPI0021A28D80|nr:MULTISPECIES: phage integrase SAM-like domain-containing protein [Bacteroidaceae]
MADLTVNLMKDFQAYLVGKGLKMNTISLYNRILKTAYNYALDEEILQTDKRP